MGKNTNYTNQKFLADELHVCKVCYCSQTGFYDGQNEMDKNKYLEDGYAICKKIGAKQFRRTTTGEIYNVMDMYNTMGERVVVACFPYKAFLKQYIWEFSEFIDRIKEVKKETIKNFEDILNGRYVKKKTESEEFLEKLVEENKNLEQNESMDKTEQEFEEFSFDEDAIVEGTAKDYDPNWERNMKFLKAYFRVKRRLEKQQFLDEAGIDYNPRDLDSEMGE